MVEPKASPAQIPLAEEIRVAGPDLLTSVPLNGPNIPEDIRRRLHDSGNTLPRVHDLVGGPTPLGILPQGTFPSLPLDTAHAPPGVAINPFAPQVLIPAAPHADISTTPPSAVFGGVATAAPMSQALTNSTQPLSTPSNTQFPSTDRGKEPASPQREASAETARPSEVKPVAAAVEAKPVAAGAEAKTERTNETQKTPSLSEREITGLSHKDLSQALDAALSKVIQGSPGTASMEQLRLSVQVSPQSAPEPLNSTLQTRVDRAEASQPIAQDQLAASPQKIRDDHVLAKSPPSQTEEKFSESQQRVPHKGHYQNQQQDQTTKHNHLIEQRIEQVVVIQQMLSIDTTTSPAARVPLASDPALTLHPRHESTTVAIEKLRESVLDKLTTIQTLIGTTSNRKEVLQSISPTIDTFIQGRGDFVKATPLIHDVKPFLDLRHGDRSGDSHPIARLISEKPSSWVGVLTPGSATAATEAHQRGATVIGHSHSSLDAALRALQKFTQHGRNFRLIQKMDSPLEKACLAMLTGVALGVMGIDLMLRTTHGALRDIHKLLRETKSEHEEYEANLTPEAELEGALLEFLNSERISPAERGVVADVSGMIVVLDTQAPIDGVLVTSRELGACVSDSDGRFLFSNIKLGTPYELRIYKSLFELTPNQISGVCSFDSHHRLEVKLTRLT